MKYRINKSGSMWSLDDYFRYLEANRQSIPESFADFVCDPAHYLDGEESLRGAGFVSMNNSPDTERVTVIFRRNNGRLFTFRFRGVYAVSLCHPSGVLRGLELKIHRLEILRKGFFRYEFQSVAGDKIFIDFRELTVSVKRIAQR